jgi:ubiquinone/menaquinone biosynthesis C-methylase UbiE
MIHINTMKMSLKETLSGTGQDKLPNIGFRIMLFMYWVYDLFFDSGKRIDAHLKAAGITEGQTVVDYGCGPGRYTVRISKLVGDTGKVYACDIHEMAVEKVQNRIKKHDLKNVETVLAEGYSSSIPDNCADTVCALDMFHFIRETRPFLQEMHRMLKDSGILVISEGHQPREEARRKILNTGLWSIVEEDDEVMRCRPV